MLALTNALLIDGTGTEPVEGATVVVDGKEIAAVGADVEVPQGATVIDLDGRVLMPGLIDAHIHLGGSPTLDARAGCHGRVGSWDYSYNLNRLLECGITACRTCGDQVPDIFEVRDAVEAGEVRGPHIVSSGRFIQAFEGHPAYTVYFADADVIKNACVMIHKGDGEDRIKHVIDRLADEGADFVKIFGGDDNKTVYPSAGLAPTLSSEQEQIIARLAHEAGMKTACHIDDVVDFERAVDNGIDFIEHAVNVCTDPSQEYSDELIAKVVERGVCVTPTIIATRIHEDKDWVNGAPSVMDACYKAVGKMIKAGVTLGAGTDSGIPFQEYGYSLHDELEELVTAGMTPMQALCAATSVNSKILMREEDFGTVETGKHADLLILNSNPLNDIKNTRDIAAVMRDGSFVVDHLLCS